MYRKTYVEIDCEALENNVKDIKQKYSDYEYYFGVVKANCYSHGFESIKYLIKGGINYLAISSLEEALKIRKIDKKIPILILEPIHYEDIKVAIKNDITITIDNVEQFKTLKESNLKLKFHLKIDTGMNRFGLKDKEEVKYIFDNCDENVFMEGIFTQLSSGSGNIFLDEKRRFENLTSLIDLKKIPIVHLDRSLTMEQHEKIPYANGVRLGILMYGFKKVMYPLSWKRKLYNKLTFKRVNFIPSPLEVKPALKFYTEVIELKRVFAGESIGYTGMCDAKQDVKVAILPYGFADYLYINPSHVCINDKFYKIAAINMDVTTVIVDENVKLHDRVEIFGDKISIRAAAGYANQNVYKTMCSITNRVPRVYVYKNKKTEIEY